MKEISTREKSLRSMARAQRILAEPASVLGVHLTVAAPAIDEVPHVEGVRGREDQLPARSQVAADAGQESLDVAQVLNELAGEHRVERSPEVEVLCVGQAHVEVLGLQLADGALVDVDADQVRDLLAEQTVHPVRLSCSATRTPRRAPTSR